MKTRLLVFLVLAASFLSGRAAAVSIEDVIALQDKGDVPAAAAKAAALAEESVQDELPFIALLYSQLLIDLNDTSAPLEKIESAECLSPELADYIRFNLARIYFRRGVTEKALEKIESIKNGTPGAYFKYRCLREKAAICEQAGLFGKEALVWEEIGAIENISGQKKKEALFKEAVAWERSGAAARAKRIFRTIAFDFAPNPFGSKALKAYLALGADDYPPKEDLKKEEMIQKMLNCGRAGDALELYRTFPKEKENNIILTQILYKARNNEELFRMADEVLKKAAPPANGDRGTVLKALWATLRTNDLERAAAYHKWLKANLPSDHKLCLENSYAMGCVLYVNGRLGECIPHFEAVQSDKAGQFYRNALYKGALSRLALGEKPEGLLNPLIEENSDFRERALYSLKKWYSLEPAVDPLPADSYYSAVSDKNFAKKCAGAFGIFEKKLFAGKPGKNSLAYELYRAGFPLFALDRMEKEGSSQTRENTITRMMLLSEIGEICFEIPKDFDYRLGLSHPTPWRREIMLAAKEAGVDPALMFAIARRESRFDPLAYSNVGAVGLFQLMPDTAKKIAGEDVSEEDLLDPLTNARIAARYMKELTGIFPASGHIAASYNAGEDVVSVWRKSFGDEEALFTLMIPYYETQDYTEGVLFDKAVYSKRLEK